MYRVLMVVAALALLASTVYGAWRIEVPRMEHDLEQRTRALLDKARLSAIEVDAMGRHIRLTGTAPDYRMRRDAEELALSVHGVAGVDNRIVLMGEGDTCKEELASFVAADPVPFSSGSVQLEENGERALTRLANLARNCHAEIVVAPATRAAGDAHQRRLARARIDAVRRYLVRSGVPEAHVHSAFNQPPARSAGRQRVEIWIVGDPA